MIQVNVAHLSFSNMGFVVLLRGDADNRTLPIFIGPQEAQSIAIQLNGVEIPRPLTHDLFKNVLDMLECRLVRVEVCDLREKTFYGRLILEYEGRNLEVDSRPSDAIALALRYSAPIYVDGKVMDEAGVVLPEDAKPEEHAAKEAEKQMTPLENLQVQLQKAVEAENYEEAAKIRDQIKELTHSN
ncbi:MAG: bifunctional nuclease family protein [Kiritimatiellae bacterium]|nr:bifunctional nuclease family protein [Kiritimatiellia bacterium]